VTFDEPTRGADVGAIAEIRQIGRAFPYLFPATTLATAPATTPQETIVLYLPPIGGLAPLAGLPIIDGAFTLARLPTPNH